MDSLRFLTVDEVIKLHRQAIGLYGGEDGVRDPALLESAVLSVQQSFAGEFLYSSIAEMAAAYWFGLVMNHAFVDGNKRIGLRAADVFLALNGVDLAMSSEEAVRVTLQIATREITRDELATLVRVRTKPL